MAFHPACGAAADLKLAARRLAATPLFTIFAVLSLGVGVGVTTAVYSVVESIFLKDLGIPDPERLLFVVTPYDGRLLKGSVSPPDFEDFRAAQRSFSALSASVSFESAVTLTSTSEVLAIEAVDGAYFSTLGVTAAMGRPIQRADDAARARVTMVSDGLWRRRFAASPQILGQTIRISGQSFEVVGVTPRSFDGANGAVPGTKLWIPLGAEPARAPAASSPREQRRLLVFGRLAPAVTVPAASAEVTAIAAGLDRTFSSPSRARHPGATERPWKVKSAAAITSDDTFLHRFGLTLVALVALVLVVACTNLANLVLARGTTRQQELAVRCALGAPRWRLVREQCAESLLLAIAGATASCVVFQGLRVLMDVEYSLSLPFGGRWTLAIRPEFDMTAAGVAAGSLLLSLVVFGLEPALQLTRSPDLRGQLATGSSRPRARRQRTLLRWQVAISAGFFVVATMFVKYTIAEARHDSGVEVDRLAVAVLNFQTQQWDEARVRRTLDRLIQEAHNEPAVTTISASTGLPFGTPGHMRLRLSLPGQTIVDPADEHRASGIAVTPSLFGTLGVPILQGRGFDDRDQRDAVPVAILSAFTARRIFGTGDPIGQDLAVQGPGVRTHSMTVIGIARDTDVGMILGDPRSLVYLPLSQHTPSSLTLTARSSGDTGRAVSALRNVLRRTDPDLAVDAIGTGRAILSGPFVFLRSAGWAALALGIVTLLLAMAGLFGIQSHLVARRTQEIGVRMSLGASAGQIKRMVLREGYRPVLEGLAIGLFIGVAGRAIVRAYMQMDTGVIDPWMLAVVPIPMILAAFCACYLPARRAAGVDPNVALRHL